MGIMACIGGNKLTKQLIAKNKVFSANLVTEELLPAADYFGNKEGFDGDKKVPVEIERGAALEVPIIVKSPWVFELEVDKAIPLDDGEVFLCKIRNILADERLCDENKSPEERLKEIRPIHTTCQTYFSWEGNTLGMWGDPMKKL